MKNNYLARLQDLILKQNITQAYRLGLIKYDDMNNILNGKIFEALGEISFTKDLESVASDSNNGEEIRDA